MSTRNALSTLRRWIWDPRPAITVGALLIAGSAAANALTWPPSHASMRTFIVGVLLVLRGLALPLLRRWLERTRLTATGRRLRPPHLMERMGHSSPRAALIYLHATRQRDQQIAVGSG